MHGKAPGAGSEPEEFIPGTKMGLKPQQREAFDFIVRYIRRHSGVSPTLTEITRGLGLSSRSSAALLVNSLVERGFIELLPGRAPRSILVKADAIPTRLQVKPSEE